MPRAPAVTNAELCVIYSCLPVCKYLETYCVCSDFPRVLTQSRGHGHPQPLRLISNPLLYSICQAHQSKSITMTDNKGTQS